MSAACFDLQYKGFSAPIICPGFFEGELSVLDALHVTYKIITGDEQGDQLRKTLNAGIPVLCYYSSDNLNDADKKGTIGPMSSCIILKWDEVNDEFITNLSSVHFTSNQPCKKLIGAMHANLLPISPQMRYVYIQEIDTNYLESILNQCIDKALIQCSRSQSIDTASVTMEGVQYYRGGKACDIMQKFFESIGENMVDVSLRDLLKFYTVYLRIAVRFWCFEFSQENDGFNRKAYIESVLQKHTSNRNATADWARSSLPLTNIWNEIFLLLCKDNAPNRSSYSETFSHAKRLSNLFCKAKTYDNIIFHSLGSIVV